MFLQIVLCFHLLTHLSSAFILIRGPCEQLLGVVTDPIPAEALQRNLDLFRRGAFEKYDPTVHLNLETTRFLGRSHEDIRNALNAEGNKEPFIVLDEGTARDDSVWVPYFVVALSVVTDIMENIPYPYDPNNFTVPAQIIFDWDDHPPPPAPAYIVAAPGEFEVTRDPRETSRFLPRPLEVVRLKEAVARANLLVPKWTVVTKKYDGDDSPEGSLVFGQPWDLERRPVSVAR
ncbi:MAG: hypothetical protein Q9169_008231 [Polycauliona sp. 2 TL-2023]